MKAPTRISYSSTPKNYNPDRRGFQRDAVFKAFYHPHLLSSSLTSTSVALPWTETPAQIESKIFRRKTAFQQRRKHRGMRSFQSLSFQNETCERVLQLLYDYNTHGFQASFSTSTCNISGTITARIWATGTLK